MKRGKYDITSSPSQQVVAQSFGLPTDMVPIMEQSAGIASTQGWQYPGSEHDTSLMCLNDTYNLIWDDNRVLLGGLTDSTRIFPTRTPLTLSPFHELTCTRRFTALTCLKIWLLRLLKTRVRFLTSYGVNSTPAEFLAILGTQGRTHLSIQTVT